MSKNARKILSLLSLILLTLFLTAAIPVILFNHGSGSQTPVAVADEVQPADDAEKTVVPNPANLSVDFNGFAWGPDSNLVKNYAFGKILNGSGDEVEEAKDAGKYTVYVTPAENCVWSDGSVTEKTFTLTINKVKLKWNYRSVETNVLYREFTYAWNTNRVYEVTAEYGNLTYSKEAPYSNIVIVKNENTEALIQRNVTNVGTYTFTVARKSTDGEELDYESAIKEANNYENPTFTIKILPQEVNIGNPLTLKWVLKSSGYKELNTSRVYEYTYNEVGSTEKKSFYAASEMAYAPYDNWENWKDATKYEYTYNEAESTEVKTYVSDTRLDNAPKENWENWKCVFEPADDYTENKTTFAYRQNAVNAIKLNNDSGALAYFEATYSGTEGSEPGRYVATAVIKAVPNYILTYEPSGNLGMQVTDNGNDTYTVTKIWYILQYFNEFIASSSAESARKEAYEFPEGWVFGAFPEGGVSAPCVAHGDEVIIETGKDAAFRGAYIQPDGYALAVDLERILDVHRVGEDYEIHYAVDTDGWQDGSLDIVTFTLTCGDKVICQDQPRSRFAYYVNEYMPIGKYNVTFTAKSVTFSGNHNDWWSGFAGVNCGSEYIGIEASFDFEVYTNAESAYDDTLLNFYGHDSVKPFEVDYAVINGDYANFFAVTSGMVNLEGAIKKSEILASNTYWATVADEYYDEAPYLTFSLSSENAEYLNVSAAEWATLVPQAGTYTFYYTLNMRNYHSVSAENGGKYVTIVLYEVLEIPEFVKVEYTGAAQAVLPVVEDARYTIKDNEQTEIGEYKATLTLTDAVHYRWKGVEGAVCKADFEITKATNKWTVELKLDNYQWNAFDANVNLIYGTPTVGTPVFKITTDEEGEKLVEGLESFTATDGKVSAAAEAVFKSLKSGTYYLWASADGTEIYKPIENYSYAFTVELAENGWVTEPGINTWSDGDRPNLPYATSLYGTVTFKIVAEDDETQVYYDSVNNVDKLASLSAGRYLLIASVVGTEDTYKGIELTKAFIVNSSVETLLRVFLIIIVVILVIAVIVLVILLLILKHKKGGNDGDDHKPEEGLREKNHKEIHHEAISRVVEEEGQPEEAQPEEKHPVAEQIALDELVEEQPAAEETVVEEDSTDEPEEEQPEVEEKPAEQPEVEQQPAEEQSADEPEDAQPLYEQPVYQQPMYQPMYDMYGRPMYDMYGRPMYQQVYQQQPAEEQPVYEQPVEEQPEAEEPEAVEEPVEEQPEIEPPVFDEPVAEEPVEAQPEQVEEPAEEQPAEEETAAEEPAEEQPEQVEEPDTEEPAEEQPEAEQPKPEEGAYGDDGEAE